jgi:CDP-glycerol glycerophosphotransferase
MRKFLLYKKMLSMIFLFPFYILSRFVPKNKKVWIFGEWYGQRYGDNSKYLFVYINKYQKGIKAIWLSTSKQIVSQINLSGFDAYSKYSFLGIYYSLIAGASIFVESNSSDCSILLNNGKTKLIQLWHAIPLKKIGLDDKIFIKQNRKTLNRIIKFFYNEKISMVIANSKYDKKSFLSANSNINKDDIIITGYPRNDILKIDDDNRVNRKIIYLPTFRGEIGSEIDFFMPYNFNLSSWQKYLEENSTTLIIKMHPVNKPKNEIIKLFDRSNNIDLLIEADIYELLPHIDLLITDYSSVYFDYLLTGKPIIFAPFDHNKYITQDRELYYDYNSVTPGPKCKNWDEILNWVEIFKKDPNNYRSERDKILKKFFVYRDNKNSKRVFEEILTLLQS